jgi:HD-GYP domain-containing protein (c-di-GMP phosphodiesterase class II)
VITRQLSFATRAFLFAFIPMVLTLVVSFFLVSKAVEGRIKGQLRESLQRTEAILARKEADYSQHSIRVLYALTQNPSLKAGIGLLRENWDDRLRDQVHATLVGQLRQIGESLDYDLLLLKDPAERPVVGVLGRQRTRLALESHPVEILASSLIRIDDTLYEAVSVPINLGAENLGTLVVGKEFNVAGWTEFGHTVLLQNGKVLLTTFPTDKVEDVQRELASRCSSIPKECEVRVGPETYLALPVRQEIFKDGVRLISFQSIDSASEEFTQSFASIFPMIGGGGVLLVLLFSAVGARSISEPMVRLIAQLRQEGAIRGLTELKADYRSAEVNELALEFSRAAGAVRETERRLDEATEEFIESMAQAQDARDPYTAGHSERVSENSTAIARVMGLSAEQVEIIRIGAKLHDIGKIGIPDDVLRKPGRLTREEYSLIQRHPLIGKKILDRVGRFKDFLPIVELHHENPDGSGYPYGLRQEAIPIEVRIVHVADVYDAITSNRAYRRAMTDTQAWELLRRGTGPLFDPDVIEALWTIIRKHGSRDASLSAAQPHENDSAFHSLPYA